MGFKPPTYEEYKKATNFARIRYRYGVYIQLVAAVLLLYLLFYTMTNIEEMKANPIEFAEERLGVICSYPIPILPSTQYNGSIRNITIAGEG